MYEQDVQYTSQWERRLFKRIGNYLMQNNKSIMECFDLIDTDNSQTISFEELKQALNRFQLGLSDKQLKVFAQRLGEDQKSYMTKHEFLTRFWAAYTYEEMQDEEIRPPEEEDDAGYTTPAVMQSVSHNVLAASRKI